MIAALVLAALEPSCWDVYDGALRHSARAPRPPYVTYVENIDIQYGDQNATIGVKGSRYTGIARVQYQDDGVARVEDQRFSYAPIVTQFLDPGPPELGPYGARRSIWMGVPDEMPVISSVRTKSSVTCTLTAEPYEGRPTYHLAFRGASAKIPHVDDLWVDAQTQDIWKVSLDAPVNFNYMHWPSVKLAHYEIELGYEGRYLMVKHVSWAANVPTGAQPMYTFAQYAFGDYQFPAERRQASNTHL
ncbi:MAG TPA: hypothetical protein VIO32_00745 [Candidatus Baltobacteraceae bacterium]